jgi:steroid 5-alpha reductase family enzyme
LILALGGSLVWLAALGPVVMFLFLTKVTGIPTTEARALVSRGDAYRDYQRRVSVLVPWPPKPKGGL